nr:hypothetical protein [Angustibacter aerolatus]
MRQCLDAGITLTTEDEAVEVRRLVEERTRQVPAEDLDVLGYWEWLDGLERGIAAHHAGLLPSFKEVVEPARRPRAGAVRVRDRDARAGHQRPGPLGGAGEGWSSGTARRTSTSRRGSTRRLTGRAGRRGIDVEGHAVVVWHDGLDPRALAGLASTRTYPLRSVPPDVQHGGQPGGAGRPRPGPRGARDVVRAVPGRPLGGRARHAPAPARAGHGRLRRGDDLRQGRLHRVRRAASGDQRARGRACRALASAGAGPRWWPASRRCAQVTSCWCRADAGPGTRWSSRRTAPPGWRGRGRPC